MNVVGLLLKSERAYDSDPNVTWLFNIQYTNIYCIVHLDQVGISVKDTYNASTFIEILPSSPSNFSSARKAQRNNSLAMAALGCSSSIIRGACE